MSTTPTTMPAGSVILRVDLSAWTGKAKLDRSDIPDGANLPPEDLAQLGSKRLIDPALLKPFGRVRTRVHRVLSAHGLRFLGGWLLAEDVLPSVENELLILKDEFDEAVRDFAAGYAANVDAWIDEHPQWRSIIIHAVPPVSDVASRFNLAWQAFQIVPHQPDEATRGDNLAQQIQGIASQVVTDLAADINELRTTTFEDRGAPVTAKTMKPISDLAAKCHRLALFNPAALAVADILENLACIDPKNLHHGSGVRAILGRMSDADSLQQMVDDWQASQTGDICAFMNGVPAPVVDVPSVETVAFVMPTNPTTVPGAVDMIPVQVEPEPAPEPAPTTEVNPTTDMAGLASLLGGLF